MGVPYKVIEENAYSKCIEIEDDAKHFWIGRHQRFIPHPVPDPNPPFKNGEIVSLHDWLSERLSLNVGIVSRTRAFRYYKYQPPVQQVELLGLPLQWFGASHFY